MLTTAYRLWSISKNTKVGTPPICCLVFNYFFLLMRRGFKVLLNGQVDLNFCRIWVEKHRFSLHWRSWIHKDSVGPKQTHLLVILANLVENTETGWTFVELPRPITSNPLSVANSKVESLVPKQISVSGLLKPPHFQITGITLLRYETSESVNGKYSEIGSGTPVTPFVYHLGIAFGKRQNAFLYLWKSDNVILY